VSHSYVSYIAYLVYNYTEIFEVIYKQDILAIKSKVSCDQSRLASQTDGLFLVFINLHVPELVS